MNAGAEFTGQWDDRALRLTGDFVAENEELAALAEREMQNLASERTEARIVDDALRAAAIVEAARQVGHRQRGRLTVFGTLIAEMLRWFFVWLHEADHRGRRPVAFAAGNRDRAILQQ